MRPEDRQVLDAMDEAQAEHPELADLLALCRELRVVQYRAKAQMEPPPRTLDDTEVRRRLLEGQPQIDYAMLHMDPEDLTVLVQAISAVLRTRDARYAEMTAPASGADAQALASLAREVFEGRAPHDADDPSSECVAVELALVPYLEVAAESLAPRVDVSLWHQPRCPLCGGVPDLAVLGESDGARQLVCPLCGTWWRFPRLECPFCENVDQRHLKYYPSEDGVYRLYVCELCKRYLKAVDLRQARKKVIPAVERVMTVGMDVAARERGYVG